MYLFEVLQTTATKDIVDAYFLTDAKEDWVEKDVRRSITKARRSGAHIGIGNKNKIIKVDLIHNDLIISESVDGLWRPVKLREFGLCTKKRYWKYLLGCRVDANTIDWPGGPTLIALCVRKVLFE